MNDLYITIKQTCLFLIAAAGVIAAIRIYLKWNRGEETIPLIFNWVLGLSIATILIYLTDYYIRDGNYNGKNPVRLAEDLSIELFETSLLIGLAVSIYSLVRIYKKYTDGEDVYTLIYQWIGSLFFLFLFGYIIEALLS